MAAEQKIIAEYAVRYDVKAPKIALAPKEPQSFKTFAGGATVKGYLKAISPEVSAVITEDNQYAIPVKALTKKRDISIDGKLVEVSPAEAASLTKLPEGIQQKINAITESDMIGNVIKNAQRSSTALVVGAIAGIVFGLVFKKSVAISAAVGAITFGAIATQIKSPVKTTTV